MTTADPNNQNNPMLAAGAQARQALERLSAGGNETATVWAPRFAMLKTDLAVLVQMGDLRVQMLQLVATDDPALSEEPRRRAAEARAILAAVFGQDYTTSRARVALGNGGVSLWKR